MRSTFTSRPSAARATMTMDRPGRWLPRANCTLIAREADISREPIRPRFGTAVLTWAFVVERVTRIELALSAWEVQRSRLLAVLTCGCRCPLVAVVAPSSPWLMAR